MSDESSMQAMAVSSSSTRIRSQEYGGLEGRRGAGGGRGGPKAYAQVQDELDVSPRRLSSLNDD